MQNPKEFKATPNDHWKPVAHSGPEPKSNPAEKAHPTKPTPFNHFKPVKKSGGEGIGDLSGHFKKAETRGDSAMVVGKSGCEGIGAPREPKKFKYPAGAKL